MFRLLLQSVGATAACVAFYFLTRSFLGPVVWVPLALLAGALFSRILIDFSAELGWHLRRKALEPMQGRFYSFQGITMQILECDDHCRWIRSKDIRHVLGRLPADATLQRLYPVGFARFGARAHGYLRDDALLDYLVQAGVPQAIKFKVWAERNVAGPARKIREQKRIRITALDAATDASA